MAHMERLPGFSGKGKKAMLSTTTSLFLPPTLLPFQTDEVLWPLVLDWEAAQDC